MLKRHAIQVLRKAGHTLKDISELVDVGKRSVQRVVDESVVTHHDTDRERARRRIGRPSKAEEYRSQAVSWLRDDADLLSMELLRRAELAGYDGAKSARTSWRARCA